MAKNTETEDGLTKYRLQYDGVSLAEDLDVSKQRCALSFILSTLNNVDTTLPRNVVTVLAREAAS